MAKKLTKEDIIKKLKEQNIEIVRIDGDYINRTFKNIVCKCDNCGKEYMTSYATLLYKNKKTCDECSLKNMKKKLSFSYEYVKDYVESCGFVLLDNEYNGARVKMNIKCPQCETKFNPTFDNFKKEKHKCPKCAKIKGQDKIRFSNEYVKEFINNEGYELLSEYKNCDTDLTIMCKDGHIFHMDFYHFKNRGQRCSICYDLKDKSGRNSPTWQGGLTPLSSHLRGVIDEWKTESFKKYNYKCAITSTKRNLIIHHIYSFNTILKECMDVLNLEVKPIGEYTEYELKSIENKCVELHYKYGLGVCICKEIHDKFHSIYGKGENTVKQWNEFVENYYEEMR